MFPAEPGTYLCIALKKEDGSIDYEGFMVVGFQLVNSLYAVPVTLVPPANLPTGLRAVVGPDLRVHDMDLDRTFTKLDAWQESAAKRLLAGVEPVPNIRTGGERVDTSLETISEAPGPALQGDPALGSTEAPAAPETPPKKRGRRSMAEIAAARAAEDPDLAGML